MNLLLLEKLLLNGSSVLLWFREGNPTGPKRDAELMGGKAIKGSLAEGRDRIARTSSEVDNYYKIAFSTLSIGVNRCSSCDLNLVGSDCQ